MNGFRKRFLSLAMVAGLAVFGVACDDADNGDTGDDTVEDPAVEGEDPALEEDEGMDEGGMEEDEEL